MNFIFPALNAVVFQTCQMGEKARPLLTMAARRRGVLNLQDQDRESFTVPAPQQWVVIIGDAPPEPARSLGPLGFNRDSVEALLCAASDAFLIAGEIVPSRYQWAADIGTRELSSVIIETRAEHQRAWIAFADLVASGELSFLGLADPNWRA